MVGKCVHSQWPRSPGPAPPSTCSTSFLQSLKYFAPWGCDARGYVSWCLPWSPRWSLTHLGMSTLLALSFTSRGRLVSWAEVFLDYCCGLHSAWLLFCTSEGNKRWRSLWEEISKPESLTNPSSPRDSEGATSPHAQRSPALCTVSRSPAFKSVLSLHPLLKLKGWKQCQHSITHTQLGTLTGPLSFLPCPCWPHHFRHWAHYSLWPIAPLSQRKGGWKQ